LSALPSSLPNGSDGEPAAREHLADHEAGGGASLIAVLGHSVTGIVTIWWQSNLAGFTNRGAPWFTRSPAPPSDCMPCAAMFQMAAEPAAVKSPSAKARVTMDDDLIIRLTKELRCCTSVPGGV
jgi:hypothetical protein